MSRSNGYVTPVVSYFTMPPIKSKKIQKIEKRGETKERERKNKIKEKKKMFGYEFNAPCYVILSLINTVVEAFGQLNMVVNYGGLSGKS